MENSASHELLLSQSKVLGDVQKDYHQAKYLSSDPLEYVHRYKDPLDQETVALLAALLAYGNVKQIRKSVEEALRRMALVANSPREFVSGLDDSAFNKKAGRVFENYVHRFNSGQDLINLFWLLNQSRKKHGSLGSHFLTHHSPGAETIETALISLLAEWRSWLIAKKSPQTKSPGLAFLLSSPAGGSCCKRWCMFLRWMGRKDQLDLGLWNSDSPLSFTFPSSNHGLIASQLIMPLDTHTGRISQYLGLTQRKTLDWKAAVEVTQALKRIDPHDPTRYDFALARLGILDLCQRRYREEICKKCQLLPACHFAQTFLSGPSSSMPS